MRFAKPCRVKRTMTSICSPRWCDRELDPSTAPHETFADSGSERRETMKLALPGHLWLARREPKSGSVPHDKNERTRAIEAFKEFFALLRHSPPLRLEHHTAHEFHVV